MNEIHIDPNDINNANVKLFVCGQPMFKMHPMFFDRVVKKILDRDIDSHVILLRGEFDQWTTSMADRLSVVLNNYGKESPGRIHIIPRRSREDFLKLLASADVVLDTYPFGGGKYIKQKERASRMEHFRFRFLIPPPFLQTCFIIVVHVFSLF